MNKIKVVADNIEREEDNSGLNKVIDRYISLAKLSLKREDAFDYEPTLEGFVDFVNSELNNWEQELC